MKYALLRALLWDLFQLRRMEKSNLSTARRSLPCAIFCRKTTVKPSKPSSFFQAREIIKSFQIDVADMHLNPVRSPRRQIVHAPKSGAHPSLHHVQRRACRNSCERMFESHSVETVNKIYFSYTFKLLFFNFQIGAFKNGAFW